MRFASQSGVAGYPQLEVVMVEAKATLKVAWKAYHDAVADERD